MPKKEDGELPPHPLQSVAVSAKAMTHPCRTPLLLATYLQLNTARLSQRRVDGDRVRVC